MKNLQSKTMMVAIAVFAMMVASCENEIIEPTDLSSHQLVSSSDDNVYIDDHDLVPTLFSNDGDIELSINAFTRYEYDREGKLIKMNYFKNPGSEDIGSNALPLMNDEFFYVDDRLSVLLRQYYHNNEALDASSILTTIRKTLNYDRAGRLVEIITEKNTGQSISRKHEVLAYDEIGNMVKKVVRGEGVSFLYDYDNSRKLTRMTELKDENIQIICHLTYDTDDNILFKKFYFPVISSEGENVFKRYIVKFDYDEHLNPLKNMRLPYLSLYEDMDLLSNNNFIRIAMPDKEVRFKYEYNSDKQPLARFTIP